MREREREEKGFNKSDMSYSVYTPCISMKEKVAFRGTTIPKKKNGRKGGG